MQSLIRHITKGLSAMTMKPRLKFYTARQIIFGDINIALGEIAIFAAWQSNSHSPAYHYQQSRVARNMKARFIIFATPQTKIYSRNLIG